MLSITSKQTREKTNRQRQRHTRKKTRKKTTATTKNTAYVLTKWNQLLVTENSFKLRIWLIFCFFLASEFAPERNLKQKI